VFPEWRSGCIRKRVTSLAVSAVQPAATAHPAAVNNGAPTSAGRPALHLRGSRNQPPKEAPAQPAADGGAPRVSVTKASGNEDDRNLSPFEELVQSISADEPTPKQPAPAAAPQEPVPEAIAGSIVPGKAAAPEIPKVPSFSRVKTPVAGLARTDTSEVPTFTAPVALPPVLPPLPLSLLSTPAPDEQTDGTEANQSTGNAEAAKPVERLHANDVVLEVQIRPAAPAPETKHQETGSTTALFAPEVATEPASKRPEPAAPAQPPLQQPAPAPFSAHPAANPIQSQLPARSPEREAPIARPHEPELPKPETTQPLRSVSLEFTPDGAGDIRLRLSERAGEVHISLHSADPSLSGRIHEGIHDLVGSLSSAGYDADAWTPGQGRQQQRHADENPRKRRSESSGTGAFRGILQQPVQEIS